MTIKSLNIAVNDYCNNRCQMCDIWKNERVDYFNVSDIERSILSSDLNSVVDLSITGGEPFMKKDLTTIVEAMLKYLPNLKALFTNTNCTYPDKVSAYAQHFSNKVKDIFMCLSIEGNREAHKEIRGIDTYHLAIRTLEQLFYLRLCNVHTVISTTLTDGKTAIEKLDHIRSLSKIFDADYTFRIADISETYYQNRDFKRPKFSVGEIEDIVKFIEVHKPNDPFLKTLIGHLRTGRNDVMMSQNNEVICKAGDTFVFIKASGDIMPCIYSKRKIGNLSTGINGKTIQDLGKYEPCPCCTECTIYPMIQNNENERISW